MKVEMLDLNQKRDELNRADLVQLLSSLLPSDGIYEPTVGLRLARASAPTDRVFGVSRPSLCIIAQGAKEVNVGDNLHRYDAEHFLLATVELPLTGRIVRATADVPYLSIRIELEPALVGSVMIEAGLAAPQPSGGEKAIVVSPFNADLLETVLRIARLLQTQENLHFLLPLAKRELVFRLLTSDQGSRLRSLPRLGGHTDRIAKAIDRLNRHYHEPLSVEGIAKAIGMSTSGFHDHFKRVTDMSPLQFQKQLRLQEARRLMLGENLDASTAGHRVGYEDPSYFSRDYKRHFGDSPLRDIDRLRTMVSSD